MLSGLTGVSGQLGIAAGLDDLVVNGSLRCRGLRPFWFYSQLAVIF